MRGILLLITSLISLATLATVARSKTEKIPLEQAWKRNKASLSELIEEIFNDPRREDIVSYDEFVEKLCLLFERFSYVPSEALNGFWCRNFDKFWRLQIRIVCSSEDVRLFSRLLKNLVYETLVSFGFSPLIYGSIRKDHETSDLYYITVFYACSTSEKRALEDFHSKHSLQQNHLSVNDPELDRKLKEFKEEQSQEADKHA